MSLTAASQASCWRLTVPSSLSSWHVPAAKGEEQDEVGRIRALHIPGEPLPVPRLAAQLSKWLAATHNENTTSGPKKLNFSENPFLQKCHLDILSWFNTPVFPGEQSFCFRDDSAHASQALRRPPCQPLLCV